MLGVREAMLSVLLRGKRQQKCLEISQEFRNPRTCAVCASESERGCESERERRERERESESERVSESESKRESDSESE